MIITHFDDRQTLHDRIHVHTKDDSTVVYEQDQSKQKGTVAVSCQEESN